MVNPSVYIHLGSIHYNTSDPKSAESILCDGTDLGPNGSDPSFVYEVDVRNTTDQYLTTELRIQHRGANLNIFDFVRSSGSLSKTSHNTIVVHCRGDA